MVIPKQLQQYILKWYHMYIHHHGWYITEEMICQHLYWSDIRNNVRKEVTECDVCQRIKWSTKTYSQLPAKLTEEITWDKLCVDIIGTNNTRRKGVKPLILKAITMIDPITGCFGIKQCNIITVS